MGNFAGTANWEENIYQFETTDVVLGGPEGVDNVPLKQLANRTAFLKAIMERGKQGITAVGTGIKTLTIAECVNKLILVNANAGSVVLTLPTLTADDAGFTVDLFCYGVTGNQVIVNKSGSTLLLVPDSRDAIYFGNGDSATLIWSGSLWIVADFKGNFIEVGKAEFDYKQRPNTVIADGSLLNRSQYPRLFEFAQSLGSSFVTDSIWTNTAGYKGMFSSGNNTTTFRVPDLRSMFIRGLDLGAGISYGRNTSVAGGYEADEFKSHDHFIAKENGTVTTGQKLAGSGPYRFLERLLDNNGQGDKQYTLTGQSQTPNVGLTSPTGGAETRAKNIGLIPLIKV